MRLDIVVHIVVQSRADVCVHADAFVDAHADAHVTTGALCSANRAGGDDNVQSPCPSRHLNRADVAALAVQSLLELAWPFNC